MSQTTRSGNGRRADEPPVDERSVPPELARARAVATLLDESVTVPGIGYKIGLDPILGVIPYVGDAVGSIGSLYIVFVGFRLGASTRTLAKMLAYVAIDFLLGSVPVLGFLVDAVLKVNRRNVATIESVVDAETAG